MVSSQKAAKIAVFRQRWETCVVNIFGDVGVEKEEKVFFKYRIAFKEIKIFMLSSLEFCSNNCEKGKTLFIEVHKFFYDISRS